MERARKRRTFMGGYIRGGRNTLYLTRSDVIDTLMYLRKHNFDIRRLMAQSRKALKEEIEREDDDLVAFGAIAERARHLN